MPTPLARFHAAPTPDLAVALAIEEHTRFCVRSGSPFNNPYIAALTEVRAIIAESARRNRKTGGKS